MKSLNGPFTPIFMLKWHISTLQDGAEKTTTICSTGNYCQHQEGCLIEHQEKKHKCRICGLFFHGFICSDGKVQEPTGNVMRCLLCEDIMKPYKTGDLGKRYETADLESVRKIHQERYVHHFQVSLALNNQLEIDCGLLKAPESDAYGNIELVDDGKKESIEFGPMKAQLPPNMW